MSLKIEESQTKNLYFRIQNLQSQIQKCSSDPSQVIECEIEIDSIARQIFNIQKSEEKNEAWKILLHLRTQLISHVAVNGISGSVIYFNLIQPLLPPTPLCPAYHKMQLPTISNYHVIGSNIACVRLDPSALKHFPKDLIAQALGNRAIDNDHLDLFWTVIDGRPFAQENRPLNLVTHTWSHPSALPGDDVQDDVEMGIFPEMGIENSHEEGFIAFNALTPMNVYCHGDPDQMLYSPDNAHFQIISGTPFALLWVAMRKDHRIALTKMLLIFDYQHPLCTPILQSIRNNKNLQAHLQNLNNVEKSIREYFLPFCHHFAQHDPEAMTEFKKLPSSFQYEIYKIVWESFGSPQGIHGDFGRASFEHDPSLSPQYYCDDVRKQKAIEAFATRLKTFLYDSQLDLLFHSQTLVKGDHILRLMRCANQTLNRQQPMDMLSEQERDATYLALWQLSQSPRSENFGEKTFENDQTPPLLKAQSLLLTASRQPHLFHSSIEPHTEKQSSEPLALNEVFQEFLNLLSNDNFSQLSPEERSKRIRDKLHSLPSDFKNQLFSKVYDHSNDPTKGGDSWGEIHIGDDLDVFILSFQEVMGD